MTSRLNRRLSTLDASFLYFETPTMPTHVGSINVYQGPISREELVAVMAQRLHLLPRYRQKVVFPPFGAAHPTWEDDPDFDIENHIEEVTLPVPGDDLVLSEVGGRLFAPRLPRDRPLWKLVLIHGRADGNTAMAQMIHHAMVDGVSSVDLMMVMHDLRPDAAPVTAPPASWQPAPLPDPLSLLQDAVKDSLTEAAQRWTDESFLLLARPQEAAERAQRISSAMIASMPTMLQPAPRMPFNGPISGERSFAWASFSFTEIRAIRAALGGTVNDVVLAIVAGAIGRYLRHHGRQTEGLELRSMCPVSMRPPEGRGALGNQVSVMIAPLYVGVRDPVERLRAERAGMERLKEQDQAGGFYAMNDPASGVPASVQAFMGQFEVRDQMLFNTATTNVPGPQIPLYLSGRKLLAIFPVNNILAPGCGLFHCIISYNQVLTIGANVDPNLVPDPWFYADCLTASFTELKEAAERAAAAAGVPGPTAAAATVVPSRKPLHAVERAAARASRAGAASGGTRARHPEAG
jgi:diacylglycerol O-acyltransferase / wax synthase